MSNNLSLPILLFFFFYKISHILALSMHIVRLAFWFLQQQKFCCDFDWDFFQFIYQFRVNWLYSDFRSMNMVYSFSYFCIKSDCQYFPLRTKSWYQGSFGGQSSMILIYLKVTKILKHYIYDKYICTVIKWLLTASKISFPLFCFPY